MVTARKKTVNLDFTAYYNCKINTVRNAFLYGDNIYTGENYNYRAQWIQDKIFEQTKHFAIECCAFGITASFYNIVLFIDKDKAYNWDDDEVIRRWHNIYKTPKNLEFLFQKEKLTKPEKQMLKKEVERYRTNLMSLSWFMRYINEFVARSANKEDRCTGRFWQGRFKTQALIDKQAVIATMIYVELSPLLECCVKSLKDSKCSSYNLRFTRSQKLKTISIKNKFVPIDKKDYVQLLQLTKTAIEKGQDVIASKTLLKLLQKLNFDDKIWIKQVKEHDTIHSNIIGSIENKRAFRKSLRVQPI